jgi:hypothetical protein
MVSALFTVATVLGIGLIAHLVHILRTGNETAKRQTVFHHLDMEADYETIRRRCTGLADSYMDDKSVDNFRIDRDMPPGSQFVLERRKGLDSLHCGKKVSLRRSAFRSYERIGSLFF